MEPVVITSASVAFPPYRISQAEAVDGVGKLIGNPRKVEAVARGSQIETRAVVRPAEAIKSLGSIEQRNAVYRKFAPKLAVEAAVNLSVAKLKDGVDALITTSCTGYMVPGLDVAVAQGLGLPPGVTRLPITEAGCAGGVLALARAADFLHAHASAKRVLVVASELCSLAFHASAEAGNLISALIFGDGAAAAVLEKDPDATGLQIIDSASLLLPNSTEALGFDLTDEGFYPRLSRELPDILASPTADAAAKLAAKHGFGLSDVEFWLLHPGGPRVLEAVGSKLCLTERQAPWSWDSLRECGNMSSAAILDVIRRYLGDAAAPRGLGMIVAFGPGASIELLLVRRC